MTHQYGESTMRPIDGYYDARQWSRVTVVGPRRCWRAYFDESGCMPVRERSSTRVRAFHVLAAAVAPFALWRLAVKLIALPLDHISA
jgi:hypothetical protein